MEIEFAGLDFQPPPTVMQHGQNVVIQKDQIGSVGAASESSLEVQDISNPRIASTVMGSHGADTVENLRSLFIGLERR